jgi:uncharacterized membrane protein
VPGSELVERVMSFGTDLALTIVAGTFLSILVITLLVLGVIIFALRRAIPPAEDPGVAELKRRLAAGEISPVEYEVRVRAIVKGDE